MKYLVIRTGGAAASLFAAAASASAGLSVSAIGKSYTPNPAAVPIKQTQFDTGGTTSVRNYADPVWKDDGYYERNRDLGQTFTVGATGFWLDAVVLRTGNTANAVRGSAPGAAVFLQLFELSGTPTINDNGTPKGTNATHGFTTNHRADDYIEGITYSSLNVVTGGAFPNLTPTASSDAGKLHYMRWDLTGNDEGFFFQPGKRYAFMIGLTDPDNDSAFSLANLNWAWKNENPTLNELYAGGWGIRREGDGTLPPTIIPGANPPASAATRQALLEESLFGAGRFGLSPTTDGYPDVDTYRDHEFYLEVHWTNPVPEPAGVLLLPLAAAASLLRRRRRSRA